MSSFFSRTLASLYLLLLTSTLNLHAQEFAPSADWTKVELNKINYIPFSELRSFYKLSSIESNDAGIHFANAAIRLSLGPARQQLMLHQCGVQLSHPIQQDEMGRPLISWTDAVKLLDPILRTAYIMPRHTVETVIIDPGHGGYDEGYKNHDMASEASTTLLVAQELAAQLTQQGYKVVLTREKDLFLSDQTRIALSKQHKNAIFISLHLNKGHREMQGLESYILAPAAEKEKTPAKGNEWDTHNAALGLALHTHTLAQSKALDGQLRRLKYSILSSAECPAAMIFLGYSSHEEEAAKLNKADYRKQLAHGILQGVMAFSSSVAPAQLQQGVAAELEMEDDEIAEEVE